MPIARFTRCLFRALLCAGLLALVACASPPPAERFAQWSERFAEDWMRLSPELSSMLRYFPNEEQARLDLLSAPVGDAARAERLALARRGLAELQRHLDAPLPGAERAGALTLQWSLRRVISDQPYQDHRFAFAQTFGAQVRYQQSFNETQPLRRAADLKPYLARLAAYAERVDELLALQRRAAARGLLPPRFIVERARSQVQQLVQGPLEEEPVLAGFKRRVARMTDLDAAARDAAVAEATRLVGQGMRPAWQRVLAFFDELLPQTTMEPGLSRLPQGREAYAQALADNTTTTLGADEVHALGLREVARIEAEMDRLLRGLGRHEGSVEQRMAALRAELQPALEPDPRPMLLERYRAHVADAERRAASLFKRRPRAPVEVHRVGPLAERTASAFYLSPAPDGSRPGQFWVPMPEPSHDVLRMRSVAVHETVPGHHFQLALQQETASLPKWRRLRVFGGGSAHSEGWALYAERLAIEQGWYEGDVPSLLGAWDGLLFRARRLVADTGLHTRGWTREQAIAYGLPAHEVERYVVNPGQACAYMVGMLRIVQLRESARAALGDRFSLADFHDLVLGTGSVPLDVLAEVVDAWVQGGGKPL